MVEVRAESSPSRSVTKITYLTGLRKHFKADLQPYVCLEGCEYPRMLFSRIDEWQDHMDFFHDEDWIQKLQKRARRHCDYTSCPPEKQRFSTVQELQAHYYLVHGNDPTLAQTAAIPKKRVELSPDELAICPLCHQHILTEEDALIRTYHAGDLIDNGRNDQSMYSEDQDAENLVTRQMLVEHIASDIRSLALLSLRDISSETTRAGPSDSINHRKPDDDISLQDEINNISLSGRTSGLSKSEFRALSNRATAAGQATIASPTGGPLKTQDDSPVS